MSTVASPTKQTKDVLMAQYLPLESQLKPELFGGIFDELYNAVVQFPEVASAIAKAIHEHVNVLSQEVTNLAKVTVEQWRQMLDAVWAERGDYDLSSGEPLQISESARKIIETIMAVCGIAAFVVDAIIAVIVTVLGVIAAFFPPAVIPAAIIGAAYIFVGIFVTAAIVGLEFVLGLIAIWI